MKDAEALTKTEAKIDYAALKAGGIIEQRQRDYFILRLRVPGGRISADQFPRLAEVAKKYGRGIVHLTTRQGIEIPWIEFRNMENARRELAEAGITLGACGPRFRVVTACPGIEVCKRGLVETQNFGKEIDDKHFGSILPHKFKVSLSGCPNICAKPHENDIGFHGMVEPELDTGDCIGCGTCAEVCRESAITMEDGKPRLDLGKCIYCGDCISNCPTDSWKAKRAGYAVFAGGKMGRHPKLGYKIAAFVDKKQGFELIQRCLELYKREGRRRERLGAMIDRIGLERFKEEVLTPAKV